MPVESCQLLSQSLRGLPYLSTNADHSQEASMGKTIATMLLDSPQETLHKSRFALPVPAGARSGIVEHKELNREIRSVIFCASHFFYAPAAI